MSLPASSDVEFKEQLQHIAQWVSRRDYTVAEMRHRLSQAGLDTMLLDALIERACQLGWLADERVAQATMARKSSQWGKRRLVQHMKERGINTSLIQETTLDMDENSELEKARVLWQRKFHGIHPTTPKDKQKQIRFLISRGFSMSTIYKVLNSNQCNLE